MADISTPCIPYLGSIDRYGYGRRSGLHAHRLAYEHAFGSIPPNMTIDHLCHNADPSCKGGITCPHRRCVNADHMEAVTRGENVSRIRGRKTHCPQGHEYTPDNAFYQYGKYKTCRICSNAATRDWKRRARARSK